MRKSPGLRLQTSIVQDNLPVEIAPGLFLGSIHAAFNVEALKSNKISHVLNLAGSYSAFPDKFTYLSLSIRDKEYASLLSCLPIAAVFIDAGLRKSGVLVHCTGGRSRSPAVAMAFLIMKQQVPYSSILDHVKTLRPVISLNAGFDAQLQCLETARGNVFVANQQLLRARLAHLTQLHENSELRNEVVRKRRQHQDASCRTSSPRVLKKLSSTERLISGADERGMIGERVPSGFCLTMPLASGSLNEVSGKTFISSFIPALRSMGTMFGCQCCGQSLFCAGAIVYHHEYANLTNQNDSGPKDSTFLNALHGLSTICSQADAVVSITGVKDGSFAAASLTKKPLLAQLRLRPHSPSVLMGNGVHTDANSTSSRRRSAPFVGLTPPFEVLNLQKGGVKPQPFRVLQPVRRLGTDECKRTSLSSLSTIKPSVESKRKTGGGIWRSLTSFKSSKRALKSVNENKKNSGQSQKCTDMSKIQSYADAESTMLCQTSEHSVFLEQNTIEWKEKILKLVEIDKSASPQVNGGSALDQMTALLDEDLTVLLALNGDQQWFVDPQSWVIDQASLHPEGYIRCPREACGAIVGKWRWEGLTYSCGGNVAPAFVMKKSAVCVLGNLTSQSMDSQQH